ncbi:MAG TPA: hypothetical protein VGA64_10120 [Candidatus Polarisedimenticolia bacterium]
MIEDVVTLAAFGLAAVPACLALVAFDGEAALGRIEKVGLGFLLGLGGLTWWMTIVVLSGSRLSLPLVLAPGLAGTVILVARLHPRRHGPTGLRPMAAGGGAGSGMTAHATAWHAGAIDRLLIAGIALTIGWAFFLSILTPLEAYDAVAIWGLKAKAIYLERGLPIGLLQDRVFAGNRPDYPLLVPLAESYVAMAVGRWNDIAVKLVFPSLLTGLVILFHAALGRLEAVGPDGAAPISRRRRLLFTFLLASIPALSDQVPDGYADIAVAATSGLGTIYLVLWLRGGPSILLAISALLTGLGATAKNEGMLLALVNLTLLLLAARGRRRPRFAAGYLAVILAIAAPWCLARLRLGLSNDVVNAAVLAAAPSGKNLARLGTILYEFLQEACKTKSWNIVWPLFAAVAALRIGRPGPKGSRILVAAAGLTLLGYAAIYVVTPYDVVWHLRRSVDRLFLPLLPVVVFALAAFHEEERQ